MTGVGSALSRQLRVAVVGLMAAAVAARGQSSAPDTVVVRNGRVTLRALLWRPAGRGPFPAILVNHVGFPALSVD